MNTYQKIAKSIPGLEFKLRQAGLLIDPEQYVKNTAFNAFLISFGLCLVVFTFLQNLAIFLLIILFFPLMFMYFMKFVDLKIERIKRRIDEEIIYAGRFLIIELESGVPIYKVFEDMERNYDYVGYYFGTILDKVYLGTSMEDAINDTLLESPSAELRRVFWQILNSLKTGTDVAPALNSVIDQVVREQDIAVKEYGKKLNPIAMFYMMISIIIPSLGITMLVVLATFIGLKITMPYFLFIAGMIGLVQFMFLSMVKSSRPAISS